MEGKQLQPLKVRLSRDPRGGADRVSSRSFCRVPAQTPQCAPGLSSSTTRSSPSLQHSAITTRPTHLHCWDPLQKDVVFLSLALEDTRHELWMAHGRAQDDDALGGQSGGPGHPSTPRLFGPLFELPPQELRNPLGTTTLVPDHRLPVVKSDLRVPPQYGGRPLSSADCSRRTSQGTRAPGPNLSATAHKPRRCPRLKRRGNNGSPCSPPLGSPGSSIAPSVCSTWLTHSGSCSGFQCELKWFGLLNVFRHLLCSGSGNQPSQ